jgi:ABC-type transport system involved in cytochrome c biogenesis permease subunit
MSWFIALQYLVVDFVWKPRFLGSGASFLALLLLVGSTLFTSDIRPLMPALQNSFWLTVHVILCFISYAAFSLSFLGAMLYLLKQKSWYQQAALGIACLLCSGLLVGAGGYYLYKMGHISWWHKLFTIDGEYRHSLNRLYIPANLQDIFRENGYTLSQAAAVRVQKSNQRWLLEDSIHSGKYVMITEEGAIYICHRNWGIILQILFVWIILGGVIYFPLSLGIANKEWKGSDEVLESFVYKAITFGFPFLTLGIISGAVWADQAWGTYWSWDPKETWSLITLLIYALYLHLRYIKGWTGPRLSWIAILGFLGVLFTYFGVNYLLAGLHSYA